MGRGNKGVRPDWRTRLEATCDPESAWLRKNDSVLLQVPSAIVPETANFLFNPRHPDAASFHIADTFLYPFDVRLKT
ncbi:MAG: RES family NAD+ phosphorylase [Terriglobia bacterium]